MEKNNNNRFVLFQERMKSEDQPQLFINSFKDYYQQLVSGATGLIPETEILPVSEVPDLERLDPQLKTLGEKSLKATAVIKLNGGLGTSMGLERAKSLLTVKKGNSFLDIIAKQMIHNGVPLILMNSFVTEEESLKVLARYPQLSGEVPLSFVQHKEPKVTQEGYRPVNWPENPELEWCPPGHGDIYIALITRNILPKLIDKGYRYVFVSNADNLGATLDTQVLGYFVQNQFPFMMEVADRTEIDKKGGHLAYREVDMQLILRESAQCPKNDEKTFQDISRHKFFNTNNLWLDLDALNRVMIKNNNKINLPMIRNAKTVDPRDPTSIPVYQIESAMGSAIGVFSGAQALRVPRARFAPVKKSVDLLAVRSDAYELTDDFRIRLEPSRKGIPPIIELDDRYYKFIADLDERFSAGPPSLKQCLKLSITGDVRFEGDVVCKGDVTLVNDSPEQLVIKRGTVLEG